MRRETFFLCYLLFQHGSAIAEKTSQLDLSVGGEIFPLVSVKTDGKNAKIINYNFKKEKISGLSEEEGSPNTLTSYPIEVSLENTLQLRADAVSVVLPSHCQINGQEISQSDVSFVLNGEEISSFKIKNILYEEKLTTSLRIRNVKENGDVFCDTQGSLSFSY